MRWVSKIRLKINQKKYLDIAVTAVLEIVMYGEPGATNATAIEDVDIVKG